jgi:CBS domain-containing protein
MRHTLVADVMSKAVVSVGPEDSFIDIAKLLYSATISAVPVIGPDGGLLGVVTDADLLAKAAHRYAGEQPRWRGLHPTHAGHPRTPAGATTAAELMTSPVETVTPRTGVPEAARLMREGGLRWMPVTDDTGHVVGVVSRSDMLAVFLHDDASIRAEVVEEVLERIVQVDPARVEVEVRQGIVTLAGELDTRADAEPAVRSTERLEGIVSAIERLRYRVDE